MQIYSGLLRKQTSSVLEDRRFEMAYGGCNAGVAAAGAMDHAAGTMAKVVMEIANSSDFDREQIRGEKVTLSQAYCLLWQNPEDGDVDGRKLGIESNSGAAAAVIVDLIVLGKVEIEIEPNTTLGVKNDHYRLKVI